MSGTAWIPEVVLGAALLHAVWNAMAHGVRDKLVGFVLINLAYVACSAVIVCFVPLPGARAVPFIAASAVLETLYQLLLLQAYKLGDFGQMYPIARGTSPWIVAIVSVALLGQSLPGPALAGVAVMSAGLIALAFADGVPGRAQLPAVGAALGTGVMIASYTVVDGVGVRHASTVLGYIGWIFLIQGLILPLIALRLRGRALVGQLRPVAGRGLAGGVLSLVAYGLVVWAQSRGNLAEIAALRETSIVIAALIGAMLFRERFGGLRMAASSAVVAGIACLALTHG